MSVLRKYASLVLFVLSSFILVWQNIDDSKWRESGVIRSDAADYYVYLPSTFIYKNPLLDTEDDRKYRTHTTLIGKKMVKMSMGVAILEAPFFFGGHIFALLDNNYEADGYSPPYHLAISLSSVVYTILGLFFLWHFLKRKFSELVAGLTLVLIAFGTNLYYYSVYETGMVHPATFFLLSVLLYMTDKWIMNKNIWKSLLIGVVFGLIVLIRPINILFCIPFLFFLKQSNDEWKAHFQRLFLPISQIILIVVGAFLIILPQLLFWKVQTGSFLYYSYRNEAFFWLKPHILDGLFSFRKGWFIYTPIMFFAFIGLVHLLRSKKAYFLGIIIFIVPFFYVTFSWWCWWYGGSFGARTMIDIYPFMAIPLAALIEWVFRNKLRPLLMIIPFFLIYLNQFQSWQYSKSFIHFDGMTLESYKTIFLKDYTPIGYWEQLQRPDYDKAILTGEE